MKILNSTFVVIGVLLIFPGAALADDDIVAGLEHCKTIDDENLRLSCYDKLGGREAAVVMAAPVAIPPDNLGKEAIPGEKKKKQKVEPVNARVMRCTKDPYKKYHFYLEGGQVWKQVSDKKLNFEDCDFNVSITKDFFGYKMQQEGEKSRFRVSRVR